MKEPRQDRNRRLRFASLVATPVAALMAAIPLVTVSAAAEAVSCTTTPSSWADLQMAFQTAPATGAVICLGADIDATATPDHLSVPAGANITLELNGHLLHLEPATGPGLEVGETSSISIDDATGTGRLEAIGSTSLDNAWPYHPGIGAIQGGGNHAGSITINGGHVLARGASYAAGIGGARFLGGGQVTMTGGTLVAEGGAGASAVGAGYLVSDDNLAGQVEVVGAEDAAGLPTTSGSDGTDLTRPSFITYTSPTSGVIVTGSSDSSTPGKSSLNLAFHYRVIFDPANGSASSEQVVDYGQVPAVPTDPVRPGFTFAGWVSSVPGQDTADVVRGPVTFTAQWTANGTSADASANASGTSANANANASGTSANANANASGTSANANASGTNSNANASGTSANANASGSSSSASDGSATAGAADTSDLRGSLAVTGSSSPTPLVISVLALLCGAGVVLLNRSARKRAE